VIFIKAPKRTGKAKNIPHPKNFKNFQKKCTRRETYPSKDAPCRVGETGDRFLLEGANETTHLVGKKHKGGDKLRQLNRRGEIGIPKVDSGKKKIFCGTGKVACGKNGGVGERIANFVEKEKELRL